MRSNSSLAILATLLAGAFCQSPLAADEPEPGPASQLKTVILKLIESNTEPTGDSWRSAVRPGESIYSVAIEFDKSSWADLWSKPDLFVVIECEGRQPVVIPQIEYDWDYSRKILNVRCPTLPAHSRCVLRLYDDDSASDAIWKNLLTTRVEWTLNASAQSPSLPVAGVQSAAARFTASGELQLLDPATKSWLTLDAPDSMASAEFIVPPVPASTAWTMEGPFIQRDRVVGSVSFKHHVTKPSSFTSKLFSIAAKWWWAIVALVGVVGLAGYGVIRITTRSPEACCSAVDLLGSNSPLPPSDTAKPANVKRSLHV